MDAVATLTIPLVGPLQSWGLDSRFDTRLTAQEPSFSGVLGLICAAMGRDRSESIEDLLELQFGVRADQEGVLLRDFHTVQGCITSARKAGDTAVTNRWYLADAAFTVALEGPLALLEQIQEALRHPVWTLSLGRKACTPTVPMAGGEILEGGLEAEREQIALHLLDFGIRFPECLHIVGVAIDHGLLERLQLRASLRSEVGIFVLVEAAGGRVANLRHC